MAVNIRTLVTFRTPSIRWIRKPARWNCKPRFRIRSINCFRASSARSFPHEDRRGALLVPQRAVQEMQGIQSVFVVDSDNKVLARTVVPGERVGERGSSTRG